MRTIVHTALITVFLSVFLLASISHHLFSIFFTVDGIRFFPSSHLSSSKSQNPNLAIQQPEEQQEQEEYCSDGGPRLSPLWAPTDSILFPDWEVLHVLPLAHLPPSQGYSCLFQNGATSALTPGVVLPWGGRATLKCRMPYSVHRLRPFFTPLLTDSPESLRNRSENGEKLSEMLRWNFLAYESLSTENDVILLAKGVNVRQGNNVPVTVLRCVFADAVTTAVTSSSQEVFRCSHPDRPIPDMARISLEINTPNGEKQVVPSVAVYEPWRRTLAGPPEKTLLCACTVVYNVAKFLKEWVIYHTRIGVEKFVLYDNGSDDDLAEVIAHLIESGYDVATFIWPWPKTQESGFSHCATSFKDSCTWMTYIDVDEFVFSPEWHNQLHPSKHMLQSLLPKSSSSIGQISISCFEFGPSNRRSHPKEGVTQGYTCRTRTERRHKSIVMLDAIDSSLLNVIHHFKLKKGYKTRRLRLEKGVVNHYKYQAWSEFKHKFRRRVSAYVFDWRESLNLESKDRTPGLGNVAIEPEGWATRFCEVNDMRLRDMSRRWFALETAIGN